MRIDSEKFRKAYENAGYTQESLALATKRLDPRGFGINAKTVGRMARDNKASHNSLVVASAVLGVAEDTFFPDDPTPLDPRSKAFQASEFIIDLIDSGVIPFQYYGIEQPGEDLWDFLKHDIYKLNLPVPPRDRRHLSDSDFADGIARLKRMCMLLELSDGSVRVAQPSGEEVLLVLDSRTKQEIDAMRFACNLSWEERVKICAEQKMTYQKCLALFNEQGFDDLVVVEASWHHAWAGDYAAVRRVLRNNLNLAMQVGDRMLRSGVGGTITCRKAEFKREFDLMLEELRQMQELFETSRDQDQLGELIQVHVGRSKRIVRQVEDRRKTIIRELRNTQSHNLVD
jgi:hypothetical protein